MTAEIVTSISELRARITAWRADGARVGLVPTMGALHEGHLSLVREIGNTTQKVVVSIFVNPTQFAPHEDFDRYPRNLESDRARLAGTPADLIFAPPVAEMYPEGFATRIEVGGPSEGLESDFRPHFFAGVATVVSKLLLAAMPDAAIFGEKDYQQLLVIRRMVRDLGLAIEIPGGAILRETDGLAMSSRNAYLKPNERVVAGRLNVCAVCNRFRGCRTRSGTRRRACLDAEHHVGVAAASTGADAHQDATAIRTGVVGAQLRRGRNGIGSHKTVPRCRRRRLRRSGSGAALAR